MKYAGHATRQAEHRNGEGHQEIQEKQDVGLPRSVEELQELLQSEADRRVTQALKTAHEKWHQEMAAKLEAERKEAERLIKLSTQQKEKEVLEKYKKEIEEKERALHQKELEIKTINLLAQKKLPIEFKDFILDRDEQSTCKKLERFSALWQEKLSQAIKLRRCQNGDNPDDC